VIEIFVRDIGPVTAPRQRLIETGPLLIALPAPQTRGRAQTDVDHAIAWGDLRVEPDVRAVVERIVAVRIAVEQENVRHRFIGEEPPALADDALFAVKIIADSGHTSGRGWIPMRPYPRKIFAQR
jgi:hypothetical protein